MVVPAGIIASGNVPGKQVSLPAFTAANSTSAYVFTTATTANLGEITVTRKTGGAFGTGTTPGYDSTSAIMTFNGTTQAMAYEPSSTVQVAPLPFSFQVDINPAKVTGSQYIVNLGQGNGVGWPCWQISIGNGNITMTQATANNNVGLQTWTLSPAVIGKWYRIGVMYYRIGTSNYVRAYVNGEVKLQQLLGSNASNTGGLGGLPRTVEVVSTMAGLTFGNDGANATGYNFQGQMRNIFFGKTLFWPI